MEKCALHGGDHFLLRANMPALLQKVADDATLKEKHGGTVGVQHETARVVYTIFECGFDGEPRVDLLSVQQIEQAKRTVFCELLCRGQCGNKSKKMDEMNAA